MNSHWIRDDHICNWEAFTEYIKKGFASSQPLHESYLFVENQTNNFKTQILTVHGTDDYDQNSDEN